MGVVSGIQLLCESLIALHEVNIYWWSELMIVMVYGALKAVQNVYPGMALKVVYRVEPTMPGYEDVSVL